MSEGYRIELPVFEGPLDLLLHLVKKHELEILDIPISFITQRYLEHLDLMRALNLDIAGEFLLMAATLAYIKSRELLPSPEVNPLEDDSGDLEDAADPRAELIRRLLEYQKYKDAGEQLGGRPVVGRDTFLRGMPVEAVAPPDEAPLAAVPVIKLIEALSRVLTGAKIKMTYDVALERVSIAQRINELVDVFFAEETRTFESLFDLGTDDDPIPLLEAKLRVVVTFLAILEMARLKILRIHQPTESGGIYLTRAMHDLEQARRSFSVQDDYK